LRACAPSHFTLAAPPPNSRETGPICPDAMLFRQIADPKLAQYAYLIGCQKTGEALLIDPQRDIDRYVEAAEGEGLRITAVAETHIHADFLSGAREFAERYDTKLFLS